MRLQNLLAAASLTLLTACGTTIEKQEARYKRAMDNMAAVATKNPKLKADIEKQKTTFKADYTKVMAATGEGQKTELARLNSRIEEWTKKVDPAAKAAAKNTKDKAKGKAAAGAKKVDNKAKAAVKTADKLPNTAGSKLGATPATKLGAPPAAPAGKLGAPPAAPAGKLGAPPAAPAGKLGAPPAAPAGKLGGN